jgi:hypothetical protein
MPEVIKKQALHKKGSLVPPTSSPVTVVQLSLSSARDSAASRHGEHGEHRAITNYPTINLLSCTKTTSAY